MERTPVMIDVSSWLLFESDSELHELFPFACADSPRARRLQVLLAEARAAGVDAATITAAFTGWARVIARFVPADADRVLLAQATQLADGRRYSEKTAETLKVALELALESSDDDARPAALVAAILHRLTCDAKRRRELGPVAVWDDARELLAILAKLAGANAEAAIAECATIAYGLLFGQRPRQ
jgi:septum formation topological specificity factor MinE